MEIEPKLVDFKVIGDPLNRLLTALGNKLSREWPAEYRNIIGARELFVMHFRTAQLGLMSSLYLCGDLPPDPRRKPDYCVSLAPINRALLDILFTVLFILEDLAARCEWFHEAGWRESKLELDRYQREYRDLPEWQEWLAQLDLFVNAGPTLIRLSPAQAADPRALRAWPTPGAMTQYGVSPGAPLPPLRAFMKYLNDFFYIDLSQQTHLAAWGMVKRTGFLLDEVQGLPSTADEVKKYRYYQIAQAVAFVLALSSEIEVHFKFGLRQDALFVWGVARPIMRVVDEMYSKRYADLFQAQ